MSTLDILFPPAFPALIIAHFVALLSPGPDFFLITGHAIRYRIKGSILICFGIAVGNAIYIAIAITGWSGIKDNLMLFNTIKILGCLYLIWVGIHLIKAKARSLKVSHQESTKLGYGKQFLIGISSAILNPKNALFYMSLMILILGNKVTLLHQMISGLWMFFVVLIWDVLVVLLISYPKVQALFHHKIHVVEKSAGFILLSFSIGLLF